MTESTTTKDEILTIAVGCGMYVGAPDWRHSGPGGDWCYEPAECCWEGTINVTRADWVNRDFACIECPACGALLEDSSHYAEGGF